MSQPARRYAVHRGPATAVNPKLVHVLDPDARTRWRKRPCLATHCGLSAEGFQIFESFIRVWEPCLRCLSHVVPLLPPMPAPD